MAKRKGGTASKKVPRPREELEAALRRRHRFLTEAAEGFDAGDPDLCYPMSGELRALLYHGQWPPLLYELGLIKQLRYVSRFSFGGTETAPVLVTSAPRRCSTQPGSGSVTQGFKCIGVVA